jgi:hypothetical protein
MLGRTLIHFVRDSLVDLPEICLRTSLADVGHDHHKASRLVLLGVQFIAG